MSVNKFEAQLLAATKRREVWNQSKEVPLADSREYNLLSRVLLFVLPLLEVAISYRKRFLFALVWSSSTSCSYFYKCTSSSSMIDKKLN